MPDSPTHSPVHRQFFGDADYAFSLTPELIIELERKCGLGIGALCRKMFRGDFSHAEILETVRLALIGGGTTPENAAGLIAAYAAKQPLGETFPLAVTILETAWFGSAKTEENNVRASADEKEAPIAA